jgi:hypothetical protein
MRKPQLFCAKESPGFEFYNDMNKRNLATALPNRRRSVNFSSLASTIPRTRLSTDSRPNANLKHPLTFTIPFSLLWVSWCHLRGDNLFLQGTCRGVVAGGGGIFSGPAKLAMVQPVAIAFNQSPDEVFLSPIKYMKTGDSASLVGIY